MLIREPHVAGTFYPADREELQQYCESHLPSQESPLSAKAVILPHAGYFYSGETACAVVDRIAVPERNILIGPNHTGYGSDFSVAAHGQWLTPLGRVNIDSDLAELMLHASEDIRADDEAHRYEHSLEVMVPFLQFKNPKLSILPFVVGSSDLLSVRHVALACGRTLASLGNSVLVAVSTDMSHFEADQATRQKDRYALQAIENMDEAALEKVVKEYRITMCGFVPVYMLLVMKEFLGLKKATLVDYRTSADASGEKDRVVGYAGFIFE